MNEIKGRERRNVTMGYMKGRSSENGNYIGSAPGLMGIHWNQRSRCSVGLARHGLCLSFAVQSRKSAMISADFVLNRARCEPQLEQ